MGTKEKLDLRVPILFTILHWHMPSSNGWEYFFMKDLFVFEKNKNALHGLLLSERPQSKAVIKRNDIFLENIFHLLPLSLTMSHV